MSQELKLIYECVSYLEEQGYYGNIDLIYAVHEVANDAAYYICERFTTPDGGEVDDNTYQVIKEWLK